MLCPFDATSFAETVKQFTVNLITDASLLHNAPQSKAKEKSYEETRSAR
jgi:hypothetical protein